MNVRSVAVIAALAAGAIAAPIAALAADAIPRAASTPNTPKNWAGPGKRTQAQAIVDQLMASHPELMSITVHATPPGMKDVYTMIAGSFPDRIGNESSPGDVITIKKAVTQIEPKWGTPDWQKKVSVLVPLKDSEGRYLPAAMVIAFKHSADDGRIDTDFLAPAVRIRDGLQGRIAGFDSLFSAAQ